MSQYRKSLPQLDELFITDGGMETTLLFREGIDLPEFATFHLLNTPEGRAALDTYYHGYGDIARKFGVNFVLDSVTWRANPDWGSKLGYSQNELADINKTSIDLLCSVREKYADASKKMVVSGAIGPRGDGYVPKDAMTAAEAADYHGTQIETLAKTEADMVTAFTYNYVEEGIGVAQAAQAHGIPAVISFTVETDGRLPTGQPLGEAIEQVDNESNESVAYFMINCAHVNHFEATLTSGDPWTKRVRGLRANASKLSHEELDSMETLDDGNPVEFGSDYERLLSKLPHLSVLGGCCGTDQRHMLEVLERCL